MRQANQIITILQGDCCVSDDPDITFTTVLGSCVSVCLFDTAQKLGGINHFLLPSTQSRTDTARKYGTNAMKELLHTMMSNGAQISDLEAKIFGGAQLTEHATGIGASNSAVAMQFLMTHSIPCVSTSVGGAKARRIQFNPTTGAVRQLQVSGQMIQAQPHETFPGFSAQSLERP